MYSWIPLQLVLFYGFNKWMACLRIFVSLTRALLYPHNQIRYLPESRKKTLQTYRAALSFLGINLGKECHLHFVYF